MFSKRVIKINNILEMFYIYLYLQESYCIHRKAAANIFNKRRSGIKQITEDVSSL